MSRRCDIRASAALFVMAMLAGCSGASINPLDWVGAKSAGPKLAALPTISNPHPVRQLWATNVGGSDRYIFRPVVVGDSVMAASRAGTLVRIDSTSGQLRWRTAVGRPLSAGVGADASLVVVATEEGEVYAYDAQSGRPRWSARVSSEVLTPPEVGEDLVLVRSADNRVFAFSAEDGKRRWVYQRAAASLLVRTPSGIAIFDGTAYTGFAGGKLVALALGSGAVRWESTVSVPRGATELERVTDVVGQPAVSGREVCAVAYQGRVACFDARTGNQVGARENSSLNGVSVDARYAFLSDEKGAIHALDRATGRSVWKQDRLANRELSTPLPLAGEIAVADVQGFVHFVQRDTGTFVARQATDGSPIRSTPVRLGTGLLVQTQNGGLFAISSDAPRR